MADITNAQAVKFCNEEGRVIANLLAKLYRAEPQFSLDVVDMFEANTGGHADEDLVADGSDTDGRKRVTKENAAELKFVVQTIKARLDQDNIIALVNKWATDSIPPI